MGRGIGRGLGRLDPHSNNPRGTNTAQRARQLPLAQVTAQSLHAPSVTATRLVLRSGHILWCMSPALILQEQQGLGSEGYEAATVEDGRGGSRRQKESGRCDIGP